MKTLLIFSCCLTLLISESIAQKKFLAISLKNNEIHSLKFPNKMLVRQYGNVSQKPMVTDITADALITSQGTIPFTSIEDLTAPRYKRGGRQVLGFFVTLTGLALTTAGFAFVADDWAGPAILYFATGITVTAGGISLLSARRKYSTQDWEFRMLPADLDKVSVPPAR